MADDAVFQEAIEALRKGDKTRARELLTNLLKTDQNNASYWIWMSAAMETAKERVYCLQTALKLDPENATAKRGLILLGALPADETVQPFPINRPRAWEEKLLLAHEKPKPKGLAAVKASPFFRLGIVILLVGAIVSAVVFGLVIPRANQVTRAPTKVVGTQATFTATVTAIGGKPQTEVVGTPSGPLSGLLEVPYTPTPLYVEAKRSPVTADDFLQFQRAYQAGSWDEAIDALENILRNEPDTTYAYYYIGEAYRFKGDPGSALVAYGTAIDKDPKFGPGYVGLARARLSSDPNANVIDLLDEAIRLDPNFGEAYLERGKVKLRDNDIQGALVDLGDANERLPNSPLVFYYLAQARVKEGELDLALNAAQRANELDVTSLPTYLLLGEIHAALGNYDEAAKMLGFYLEYEGNDLSPYFLLGKIEFDRGNYEESIRTMNKVIANDRNRREPYLYRFRANVELGNGDAADEDLDRVMSYFPDLFEANLALVRTHLLKGRNGSALVDFPKTESLAETDGQKALAYYWGAIVYEKREEFEDAAKYWQKLLDLPEEAMTAEMRKVAQEHLLDIGAPTPGLKPTNTKPAAPTVTKTPTPSRTPTPTPTK